MGAEISEKSADRGGRDSGARPHPADSDGTRDSDIVGEGGLRPHSRVGRVSAPCRCEHDCPMAEGDQLAHTPSGVCAFEEGLLGATLMGQGISGGEHWDADG